jgi:hypothetical protein
MEESLIIEVWDIFKEYVPEKNKDIVANHYVDFLLGKDVSVSVLEGLSGFDQYLDQAIEIAVSAEQEDEDDDHQDDEWDSYSSDED